MNYKGHRKELLKDKAVKAEFYRLQPEYELAKSLLAQRMELKMTQAEVAEKAGMPQSTIARIEGLTHGVPKISTLIRIADALDAKLVVRLEPVRKVKHAYK